LLALGAGQDSKLSERISVTALPATMRKGIFVKDANWPRKADRVEAEAWSIRMEGYGGPAQPSPTIAQCLNGGYGWLQVKCRRCETEASIPLEHVRRPRDTPIWKLEASLKCRSCKKGRYAPPVHMIRLTTERQIAPYVWVHPDDDR
jgi:hypothetical protein